MSPGLDPRPSLTPPLERILAAIVARTPALQGLETTRILVVGLGAHGTAAASVRAFAGTAKAVVIGGVARTVELGLRPPFFLEGDAPRRLATLVHELLHLDPTKPGALNEETRHKNVSQARLDRQATRLATDLLESLDPPAVLCLAHDGEVHLRHWRHRPVEQTRRRTFGDRDIYDAPVRMCTAASARGGWW